MFSVDHSLTDNEM